MSGFFLHIVRHEVRAAVPEDDAMAAVVAGYRRALRRHWAALSAQRGDEGAGAGQESRTRSCADDKCSPPDNIFDTNTNMCVF